MVSSLFESAIHRRSSLGFLASDRLTLFGTDDGLRINKGSTILSHVRRRR